ncbi:MAG TPA: substrate-binding domain-containing protein [Vicinamibacterales bacterium]|jgi:ribose transport system substrate-binding protein
MHSHTLIPAAVVLAALAVLPACAGDRQAGSPGKRLVIAVVPKGSAHQHWKGVRAGALAASREIGVEVIWQAPGKEDSSEEQIQVVDSLRSRGVSGILLAPLDERALRAPVANAVHAGIPVALFDSGLDSQDYVSLIETNNYQAGRLAGEHLARLLDGRGPIMLLRVREGSASTTQREQGFLDAVGAFPGLQIVSSNQYAGATTDGAYTASRNLLTVLRAGDGGVAGVFCANESGTSGMLRALQEAKLAGRIRFVGFDVSDVHLQGLRAGQIDALVVQDPFRMGYLGVRILARAIGGEKVEKHVDTGVTLVTRENVDLPELQQRLHPGR